MQLCFVVLIALLFILGTPAMALITNKTPNSVSIFQTLIHKDNQTLNLMALSLQWSKSQSGPLLIVIPLNAKKDSNIVLVDTKTAPHFLEDIQKSMRSEYKPLSGAFTAAHISRVAGPSKLAQAIASLPPNYQIDTKNLVESFKRLHGESPALVCAFAETPENMLPLLVCYQSSSKDNLQFPAPVFDLNGKFQPQPSTTGLVDWRLLYGAPKGKIIVYQDKKISQELRDLLPSAALGERICGAPKAELSSISLPQDAFAQGVPDFHGISLNSKLDLGSIHRLVAQFDFALVTPEPPYDNTHEDYVFKREFRSESRKVVTKALKDLPRSIAGRVYLIVERTGAVQRVIFSTGFEKFIPPGLEDKLKAIKFAPFPANTGLPTTEVKIMLPLETEH